MRRIAPLLLAAFGLLLLAAPALAERRVALVIGNAAYRDAPLKNPVNDARDIAATLKALGFEVILRQNAGLGQMEQAVDEFWHKLKAGGTGLFFFAGHGLQVKGANYLVPVDARLDIEQDVKLRCMDVNLVLGRMENAGNQLNIVILDACRNNPFARSWRNAGQGLAKMDAPAGTLVAYATAPDSVAADGEGKNGLYTSHLLRHLRTPGLTIETVLKQVRVGVMNDTGRRQIPWESSSLTGEFYFVGGQAGKGQPPAPQPQLALAPAPKQAPAWAVAPPPGVHAAQFALLGRAGQAEAREYFQRAVQANPNDADARAGLAMALFFAGKDAEAKYQVQRLSESDAQTAHSRLAQGLVLGMEGNADAPYLFGRAAEEGADRALTLLCQAVAAERRMDYAGGLARLREYEAVVPEGGRGDHHRQLARALDLKGRLAGRYAIAWGRKDAPSPMVIEFAVRDGQLVGTASGAGEHIRLVSITDIRLEGRTLSFQCDFRVGLLVLGGSGMTYKYSGELGRDLSVIPVKVDSGNGRGGEDCLVRLP